MWIWVDSQSWAWMLGTLARLERNLNAVLTKQQLMETTMSALDDAITGLAAQVEANTTAEGSAVTLIQELATLIQRNATNPQAVLDLADKMKASADALAAAITTNTPAAPAPAPTP